VHVRVIKAQNLPAADLNGKSDPYAVVKCEKKKFKTKVIKKMLEPEWNESFSFPASSQAKTVCVQVFDKDLLKPDDALGKMEIDLTSLREEKAFYSAPRWYRLESRRSSRSKSAGEIQLSFEIVSERCGEQENMILASNVSLEQKEKDDSHAIHSKKERDRASSTSSSSIKTAAVIDSRTPPNLAKVAFKKFDVDGNGWIDESEFFDMALELGYYFDQRELKEAWQLVDLNGNNKITFDEFVAFWKSENRFQALKLDENKRTKVNQLQEYFNFFDHDKDGKISPEEFRGLHENMLHTGYTSVTNFEESMAELDLDHDGFIHFNEFLRYSIFKGLFTA